jgi:ATP-dependent protease HslVU (ClpYQ) peptidase subunit
MTCISAVRNQDRITMGGDTCATEDDVWTSINNPKVFRIDRFLFGCAGSFRMMDLLHHSLSLPKQKGVSDDTYIRTAFIDSVIRCFKNGDYLDRNNDINIGGTFLVGFRNQIYEVQDDLSVLNCQGWGAAIGSGKSAALGSLFTTTLWENSHQRVMTSLQAAEAVTCGVRGPFIIEEL